MLDHVQRAASALGLTDGPVHAECRVGPGGVFVLEVAARPIGGLCSKVLRFGDERPVPLEEVLLRHATGSEIAHYVREAQAAGVMMIPIPKRGILKKVDGVEAAAGVSGIEEVRITAKRDQLLEPLPEAGSYLGFIFARAPDPATVVAALERRPRAPALPHRRADWGHPVLRLILPAAGRIRAAARRRRRRRNPPCAS